MPSAVRIVACTSADFLGLLDVAAPFGIGAADRLAAADRAAGQGTC